jgi:hypothetical protein
VAAKLHFPRGFFCSQPKFDRYPKFLLTPGGAMVLSSPAAVAN